MEMPPGMHTSMNVTEKGNEEKERDARNAEHYFERKRDRA